MRDGAAETTIASQPNFRAVAMPGKTELEMERLGTLNSKTGGQMAGDSDNALFPATRVRETLAGDVPMRFDRRYHTDERGGPGLGFYVDAKLKAAAFRDEGGQLTATRTDPSAIRDMVAIAQHRGWKTIGVRGANDFRRESWLVAMAAGLEVRGYRPTARDLQKLTRRVDAEARRRQRRQEDPFPAWKGRLVETEDGPRVLLMAVETVVRARVSDPRAQTDILAKARDRLASWLDIGARFDGREVRDHGDGRRERQR
jgi:hypothetical protein